jgi:rhodanese-related sulfurtransferase
MEKLPLRLSLKTKNKQNMENISVEQLKARLDAGENLHVLDVREADEYAESNIGATLLPLSKLRQMDTEGIDDWKGEEVIVHCRSGKRSMEACMLLETMGFEKTVNVTGGIMDWQAKFGNAQIN